MKQTLYDLSKKQKLPKPMPVYSMPEMTSQLKPGRIYRHLSSLFISLDCGGLPGYVQPRCRGHD